MTDSDAAHSFDTVDYQVRPSKQVERKLFMEVLHRLSDSGLPIQNHTYVGFGSVFYVDFLLFHRYLYIDKMLCAEKADIPRRMDFNLPYDFVVLRTKPILEVIPEIQPQSPYLVWLDYDCGLDGDNLETSRDLRAGWDRGVYS